jgi:K+-transporting ATPase ATPase C chain
MKSFFQELRISFIATIALALLCCGVYPLVIWGISQAAFPRHANGSLLCGKNGQVIGSERIGQFFDEPKYFHPRPSAAGNDYDAVHSGGSNLGPLSKTLDEEIRERVENYRKENGLSSTVRIPADAVTASGSGLDPHISPDNAELQAPRIAQARGIDVEAIHRLIASCTEARQFGVLGEPGVNVFKLNWALDRVQL